MELTSIKPVILRNVVVRFLLLSVLIITIRFAYVITLTERFNGNTFQIYENVIKEEDYIKNKDITTSYINKCYVPRYKHELLMKSEPLIEIEPLKPWIALKRNIENVKYMTLMVDISLKRRYVYIDVGSRSYGSSIVGWFKKRYPKQNKTFEIHAIEADRRFFDEYKSKKGVTLLPYAAWVKNESLVFEINRTPPGDDRFGKPRGMGRIRPVNPSGGIAGLIDGFESQLGIGGVRPVNPVGGIAGRTDGLENQREMGGVRHVKPGVGIAGRTDSLENQQGMGGVRPVNPGGGIWGRTLGPSSFGKLRGTGRVRPINPGGGNVGSSHVIQGFDFAEWLRDTVSENDFVVVKMDVEGTEFDLVPRLIETGAICLIDEMFLECHYNRWQKCCPGVRSPKYEKTYGQCLDLCRSIRQQGVLVHQWW